ncbi:MAG: amino acid synthesis family protein [Alphaproteobacteria bacterium]
MNIVNPKSSAQSAAYENELVQVRKFVVIAEEILHEGGPRPARPRTRAAAAAILRNPYAGTYAADIMPMMEALKPLGLEMARRLLAALGGDPRSIEAYGKGAIVGEAGELEHGALWHVPGGYAMRELLGGAKAIVPSTKKVAGMGATIDIPIHHINAAYVRSHFDAMEVRVTDAPRANEIVFVIAMTTGPRVHARAGGLAVSEIKVGDGQR